MPDLPPLQPLSPVQPGLKNVRRRKLVRLIIWITIPVIILGLIAGGVIWYKSSLRPVSSDSTKVRVTIESGTGPSDIAQQLKTDHLIRSTRAFEIYTRLSGKQNKLLAGTYALAPNQSTQSIVADLTSGKTDEFSVTILPGQTLKEIKAMFETHGYSSSEIDAAYAASYSAAVVQSRGSQTSLEGLLYPETYNVLSDESLTTVFERIFAHFDSVIDDNQLSAGFAEHGLSVYQGVTLASIVQREVSSADDQKKVASVFYNRMAANMTLGSEVTFIYGADLLGVKPSPSLDSPYNLYINKGLTPTPIGSPGLTALEAVAYPAQTNYLYFLSGDDGKTYFALTDTEHEQNIKNYCQVKCQ